MDIKILEQDLQRIRGKIAFNMNQLWLLHDPTDQKLSINGVYTGTLVQIEELLGADAVVHDWYKDAFHDVHDRKTIEELKLYMGHYKDFEGVDASEQDHGIPSIDDLPTVGQYKDYMNLERQLLEFLKSKTGHVHVPMDLDCRNLDELKKWYDTLIGLYDKVDTFQIHFTVDIIADYLHGNIVFWEKKLLDSMQIINTLEEEDLMRIDRDTDIVHRTDIALSLLMQDAEWLLEYVKKGNPLSGPRFILKKPFLSKAAKRRLYVIDMICVGGGPCNTEKRLGSLIDDLKLRLDFKKMAQIWDTDISEVALHVHRYIFFKKLLLDVIDLIALIEEAEKVRSKIQEISDLKVRPFDKKGAQHQKNGIVRDQLLEKYFRLRKRFKRTEAHLSGLKGLHPIKQRLLKDLTELNGKNYSASIELLTMFWEKKTDHREFQKLRAGLGKVFPKLLQSIAQGIFTVSDMPKLEKALRFRHTRNRFKKLTDPDYGKELFAELRELGHQEAHLLLEIARRKIHSEGDKDGCGKYLGPAGHTGGHPKAVSHSDSSPTDGTAQGIDRIAVGGEVDRPASDPMFLSLLAKNLVVFGEGPRTRSGHADTDTLNSLERYLKELYLDKGAPTYGLLDIIKPYCDQSAIDLREQE